MVSKYLTWMIIEEKRTKEERRKRKQGDTRKERSLLKGPFALNGFLRINQLTDGKEQFWEEFFFFFFVGKDSLNYQRLIS